MLHKSDIPWNQNRKRCLLPSTRGYSCSVTCGIVVIAYFPSRNQVSHVDELLQISIAIGKHSAQNVSAQIVAPYYP